MWVNGWGARWGGIKNLIPMHMRLRHPQPLDHAQCVAQSVNVACALHIAYCMQNEVETPIDKVYSSPMAPSFYGRTRHAPPLRTGRASPNERRPVHGSFCRAAVCQAGTETDPRMPAVGDDCPYVCLRARGPFRPPSPSFHSDPSRTEASLRSEQIRRLRQLRRLRPPRVPM